MKKFILFFTLIAAITFSCRQEVLVDSNDQVLRDQIAKSAASGDASYYILPESTDYEHIPQDPRNPITAKKVELGRMLFFEPGVGMEAKHVSGLFTFTCSSCHIVEAGMRPGRPQGIADGAYGFGLNGEGRQVHADYQNSEVDAQGARPLALLNTAFITNSMWNGSFGPKGVNVGTEAMWGVFDPGTAANHLGYEALEAQNIEGLKTHRMVFGENLLQTYGYKAYFDDVFPEFTGPARYSRETASLAISAYLRTITTSQAPFQKWLKGDRDALNAEQKRGGLLFFGKAGCYRCHYEKNLGSMEFHALGVEDLFENGGVKTDINDRRNLGRGGFTNQPEDMFRFRVPQLYNMADAPFYFHGASKEHIDDLLHYFNEGVKENPRVPNSQISQYFHPLNLSEKELSDLKSFLMEGLRDPNLIRYKPDRVLSGMCFPNNDMPSRIDLNCQ